MMLHKNSVISLLPTIYEAYHTPLFLLKDNFEIAYQPYNFIPLAHDFFVHCFAGKTIRDSKLTTIFKENELYIVFRYPQEEIRYACIGPVLYRRENFDVNLKKISFFRDAQPKGEPIKLLQMVTYLDDHNTGIIKLLYQILLDEVVSDEDIENSYTDHRTKFHNEKTVMQILYERREQIPVGISYQDEWNLLHYVKQGNHTMARIYAAKIASKNISKMSEDALRKHRYALVALITLVTRAVRDCGVSIEQAYTLSDYYIQRLDECFTLQELYDLSNDAIIDFCTLVQKHQTQKYPAWVHACMDYIKEHLHTVITLEDIGNSVHMSPSYVSVQFKKITNTSIRQYINKQRVLEAKYLLKNSDMSIQEISMNLNFANQSYFTKIFKAETGEMPNEYRRSKQNA